MYHNTLLVFNTSHDVTYTISGLQPYSLHRVRLEACTAQGCSSSATRQVRTREAPPVGDIGFTVDVIGSREVQAYWTAVDEANGVVFYEVYFGGMYYVDPG